MDQLIRDLRYGIRGLLRSPGFAAVAILTIALGIGVNSTIFSLVNAILFKPLPVERSEMLVDVYGHAATSSTHDANSYPNFLDYQTRTETLSGMMAYTNFFANLSIEGSSELVVGEIVSEDYFNVLGVRPTLGRAFSPDEFQALGASPVAVLSHGFWQSRFGGDREILGRDFRMNGIVYTVVGVAPASFGGMFPAVTPQMWIPLTMVEEIEALGNRRLSGTSVGSSDLDRRGLHFLWIKGRMRDGVELETVRAELQGIAAQLSAEYPETNELERLTVLSTNDVAINPDFDRTVAPAGFLLLGAVGLVLLVACANLANMLLARASSRRRELAVRIAIGASRGRLIRQMLTESILMALAGGAVAVLLAFWLAGVIAGYQPPLPIDLGLDLSPDWRVITFTVLVAGVTGILFGIMPALRASRPDLVPALKDSGDGASKGRRWLELRDALVIAQVAVSVVLLIAGSLMVRSLTAAGRVDFGYDVSRTAYLGLAMEMNGYGPEEAEAFYSDGTVRLSSVPGVEAVGLTSRVPLSLNNNGFGVFIEGHQSSSSDRPYGIDGASIDEGYFQAMDLEILEGRGIRAEDRDGDRRVAVVTEEMSNRFWPGEGGLGREFRGSWDGPPFEIVGIVEDYRVDTPGEDPKPYIHIPLARNGVFSNYVIRTATPAPSLVPDLERTLRALDPDLVFLDTGSFQELADVRLFPVLAGAWLIGVFGSLALILAAVGLYGVIGYAVSRRTRELGIRKALGAESRSLVVMVVRRGMLLVAAGFVVGAILAGFAARLLSSVLFVSPVDIPSFAVTLLVLCTVAALANLVPALRASRVNPMTALRSE
ncbi:MAG: ABC transporter permease [Gemmatimonadetes bacterium]|nr:ABC transporter permease [Gemmatimonadota bacterium]NNM05894.1 ABC transporter permease [Gemmatimonadota bacterium]